MHSEGDGWVFIPICNESHIKVQFVARSHGISLIVGLLAMGLLAMGLLAMGLLAMGLLAMGLLVGSQFSTLVDCEVAPMDGLCGASKGVA